MTLLVLILAVTVLTGLSWAAADYLDARLTARGSRPRPTPTRAEHHAQAPRPARSDT